MDRHIGPGDIRRMIADGGFADLVDGRPRAIPRGEVLIRALALAAERGHLELVEDLVREGAADPGRGADALITAAEAGHADIVAALIGAGVPVDARCEMFAATALMHAAGAGAAGSVAALLASGADADAIDREGRAARDWAALGAANLQWEPGGMSAERTAEFRRAFALLGAEVPAGLAGGPDPANGR